MLRRIAILLLLCACSEGGFQGNSKNKKESAEEEERRQLGDEMEGIEDGEDDLADHPAMVSGAFLTCEPTDDEWAHCRVEKEEEKVSLTGLDTVYWQVLDHFNRYAKHEINYLPELDAWSVKVKLGAQMPHRRMQLQVSKGQETRTMESQFVKSADDDGPEVFDPVANDQTATLHEFGIDKDFRLGNGTFDPSANSDCSDLTLQNSVLSGKTLTIAFEVKSADTSVGITLQDVCGAVAPSTNRLKLLSGNSVVAETGINSGWFNHRISLRNQVLQPGSYQIQISSGLRNEAGFQGDYDDYVVGEISIITDKNDVTFSDPVAN